VQGVSSTASFKLKAPNVPASISATLRPDPAPADGKSEVEVLLEVKDASGAPLSGAMLQVSAEKGRVGPVTDEGQGRYRAAWVPSEGAEGAVKLEVKDSGGNFAQPVVARLREKNRFELGLRGGFVHSLGDQLGPRAGVELWRPFSISSATLGIGLSASWLYAAQEIRDAAGTVVSRSEAHLFPLALRLGYEAVYAGRFNLLLGVGGVLAYARMTTQLTGVVSDAVGGGAQGFVAAGLRLGPGRAFFEVSYGYVPVRSASFTAQAGGLAFDLGYRFLL
jgi:hypothetical protein